MTQLTIRTQTPVVPGARRRPMRSERMVGLRSAMPLGLVTLRHDVPEYIRTEIPGKTPSTTTPKVDTAARSERAAVETPARKGGEAQW
jgi:hypothetical protein